jgi:hypothetical protein
MYKEQNDLKTQTFRPLKRCNSYERKDVEATSAIAPFCGRVTQRTVRRGEREIEPQRELESVVGAQAVLQSDSGEPWYCDRRNIHDHAQCVRLLEHLVDVSGRQQML